MTRDERSRAVLDNMAARLELQAVILDSDNAAAAHIARDLAAHLLTTPAAQLTEPADIVRELVDAYRAGLTISDLRPAGPVADAAISIARALRAEPIR